MSCFDLLPMTSVSCYQTILDLSTGLQSVVINTGNNCLIDEIK